MIVNRHRRILWWDFINKCKNLLPGNNSRFWISPHHPDTGTWPTTIGRHCLIKVWFLTWTCLICKQLLLLTQFVPQIKLTIFPYVRPNLPYHYHQLSPNLFRAPTPSVSSPNWPLVATHNHLQNRCVPFFNNHFVQTSPIPQSNVVSSLPNCVKFGIYAGQQNLLDVSASSSIIVPKHQPPRFHCTECNRSYSTFNGLSKHRQFHCASQMKRHFGCKFCERKYSSLG